MLRYRHGDVGLVAAAVPEGAVATEKKVLAYGEATGHRHAIAAADVDGVEMYETQSGTFLRVTAEGGVSIVHEEHGAIQVAPGDYEVRIAREYDEEEDFRPVVD